MSCITYAPNYEDVLLYRAFKDIDIGFYIDVGAKDSNNESVTRAFYERGWHGINITPFPTCHDKLQRDRPNDVNLAFAAGDKNGEQQFFEIGGTGFSTLNEVYAKQNVQDQNHEIRSYSVRMQTLDGILADHPLPVIHFLKIDVEGAEEMVLRGLNLQLYRPWVILVKSTESNSEKQDYVSCEQLLCSHNYHFVYFDGLNCFYVADEKQSLDTVFKTPPNIHDHFKTAKEHQLSVQLEHLKKEIENVKTDFIQAQADLSQAHSVLTQVYTSRSWLITAPFRFGTTILKHILTNFQHPIERIKLLTVKIMRFSLRSAVSFLNTRPRLRSWIFSIIAKFPRLKTYFRRLMIRFSSIRQPSMQFNNIQGIDELPHTAKRVYKDLKDVFH